MIEVQCYSKRLKMAITMKLIWNNRQIESLHGSSETPKIWL